MIQSQEKSNAFKRLAQTAFIIYVFSLYMFSFQTALVNYTEYIFLGFAGIALVYVLQNGSILIAKEHTYILVFCLISLLSSIWAIDFATAFRASISLFLLAGMSILVYQVFDKKDTDKLLITIFFAGVALIFYTAITAGFDKYFNAIITGKRLGGAMNAPNIFGVYCSISFVIGLYLLKKNKVLYGLFLVVLLSGILASGSRNAFIIMILGSILSMYYAFKQIAYSKRIIYTFLLIALFVILYLTGVFNGVFERFNELESSSGVGDINDPSFNSRLFMIEFGLEKFINRPFFGYGISNAQFLLEKVFARTYLHNNYIELLVNVGLIGFCFYYASHIKLLRKMARENSNALNVFKLVSIIFILLLVADISIVFYYNKLTYIVLTIAMILYKAENGK